MFRNVPKGCIDIGRSTVYGNPFKVREICQKCNQLHSTPSSTLPCFEAYFRARLKACPNFYSLVMSLKGKKLWCPGCGTDSSTCHGRIIEKVIIEYST